MYDFIIDEEIDKCELRVRCAKALLAKGFKSILELAKLTDKQILSIKGIGPSSLEEIRTAIAAIEKQRGVSVH